MTKKEIDAMTPAMKAMWCVQTGMNPDPPATRTNKRAKRMQDAIEDYQKAMNQNND